MKARINERQMIVLGGGCFWCIEAVFENFEGIIDVTSGYAGGDKVDPTYEEVCTGNTGHAEVVRLIFDPSKTTLNSILKVFFKVHDPTTVDRQGPDVGSQYRSIILYENDLQREIIKEFISNLSKEYEQRIVTEVKPLKAFFKAEDYHQKYFTKNPDSVYCRVHIPPKLEKAPSVSGSL